MASLVFDYDGTLHDCIRIYAPAFRMACRYLEESGRLEKRERTDEEIGRWLGFSAVDMWNSFAPGLTQREKEACSAMIGAEMVRLTETKRAKLYPGAIETLEALKAEGHRMIFLSNCKRSYMDAHRRCFSLERYFDGFFCAEEYGWKPKTEIFPLIKQEFDGEFVIIGDRFHDMEVARRYHLKSIGCTYGYGTAEELAYAAALAGSPAEIREAAASLLRR